MKKILGLLVTAFLFSCTPAMAQQIVLPCVQIPGTGVSSCAPVTSNNPLPISVYDAGNHSGYCYTSNGSSSPATFQVCGGGGGTGTVTSVSVVTANGVSGSVATPTTTPAITLTLGAITPTTVNGNTITTGTGTLTIGAGKALTDSNTLTFTGTDGSSVNFGTGGTVLYGNQSITLSGDTTGSGTTAITTTTGKVNGVAYASGPSIDTTPIITASNTATYTALPNCVDSGGNHLNYTTSTHLFSCGTSGGGGTITLGTSAAATNPQRTSEAGTGFYSLNSGEIDAALTSNQAMLISATSTANFSLGYENLNAITTGASNTFVGYEAGHAITTGSSNVFIGNQAQVTGTTISNAVVIGASALAGSGSSVVIGQGSSTSGATGGNVAILGTVNSGNGSSVAIGGTASCAGCVVIGGFGVKAVNQNAIAIGAGALVGFSTGTNSIAIGASASTVGDNSVVIGVNGGNQNISGANNVLIGPTVAHSTLTTGADNIMIGVNSAIDAASSSTSNTINIGGTGGSWVLVTGTNTNSTESATMNGSLVLPNIAADTGLTDASVCEDTTNHKLWSGSGTLGICLGTSSLRYKTNVVTMNDGLDQVQELKPVNFFYKEGHGDNGAREQYGFLAEDVVKVLPKLTSLDAEGKPNSVDILGMVPVLVKAVQEQQAEIKHLKDVSTNPCHAFNALGRLIMGCNSN